MDQWNKVEELKIPLTAYDKHTTKIKIVFEIIGERTDYLISCVANHLSIINKK